MIRSFIILLASMVCFSAGAQVVVDNTDDTPLPLATVFNQNGTIIGMTDENGNMPKLTNPLFPLTIRYMGYDPLVVNTLNADSLKMTASTYDLPEITIQPVDRPVTRMIVYVRQYASMTTSKDTIDMFADYMADLRWARKDVKKFKRRDGRLTRTSPMRAYVHMKSPTTDSIGFPAREEFETLSWSDLIQVPTDTVFEPRVARNKEQQTDTVVGKSGYAVINFSTPTTFCVKTDVIANTDDHKLSFGLLKLLGFNVEFSTLTEQTVFPSDSTGVHLPESLASYSMTLEATGKGRWIKKLLGSKSNVDIKCYYEVYPVDIEHLTVEQWREIKKDPPQDEFTIPTTAPALAPEVESQIERACKAKGVKW